MGLRGNELADKMAKQTLKKDTIDVKLGKNDGKLVIGSRLWNIGRKDGEVKLQGSLCLV